MSRKLTSEIVEGRLKIELPKNKWISKFSCEFPDLLFSITSMSLVNEEICNTLIEIKGKNIEFLSGKC